MATTPVKPTAPPAAPRPAAPPTIAPPQTTQVNIHGIPPSPHMAPEPPSTEGLSEWTKAEMETGKKALEAYKQRGQAELAAGQQAIARHGNVTPESKEGE